MRSRHCRVCGEWHDLNGQWPSACLGHFASRGPRSTLSAPTIIRDGMEPVQSMVSGRMHDSKRAYQAEVRAAGCEIVGDERAPFDHRPSFEPQEVGRSIKDAIDMLEAGYVPPPDEAYDIAA